MKYKFHETPPVNDYDPKEGFWQDGNMYIKELNWISKNLGLDVNKFKVDDVTFGYEPAMFYAGKYFGYLDQFFYSYFDVDDWEGYWGFDN